MAQSASSEVKYRKSEGDSRRYREAGNKHYLAGRDVEAIRLFNKAIVAAPQDAGGKGRDLSLAVANRSASLLRLGYRDLCLQQVQLAITVGYPSELRWGLASQSDNEDEVKYKEINRS